MTTYTSIRIYISSSASILPNSFYNVVGYLGASVGNSIDPFHINKDFNSPVIKTNGHYYYLTYNDNDGFRPNLVDDELLGQMFVPSPDPRAIYLEQRDDAHLISNYESPLGANFVIDNIDNLYVAYRVVTVNVYDNYAIESYGPIFDRNSIIDVVDADLVLAATNPDGVQIVPNEGVVTRLYSFELTYPYNITSADSECIRKIALYDYNTRNIATSIDLNSIAYTIGSNKVTFSLLVEIESPSTYFLYIPTNTFTYANSSKSQMAMFAYTIRGGQGGGSIYEFAYTPTITKKLKRVALTFYNLISVTGVSYLSSIQLSGPNGTETFACEEGFLDVSGNSVIITFPNTYENFTPDSVTYTITIPGDTIQLQQGVWMRNQITLDIEVIGTTGSLPTNGNYLFHYAPGGPDLYGVSYFNVLIKFPEGVYGNVELNDGHAFNEITLVSPNGNEFTVHDHIGNATEKPLYQDDLNYTTHEFDCKFSRTHKEESVYIVVVPAEMFRITIYNAGTPETYYNLHQEIHYNIITPPNSDEGDTPGYCTFDYKLLTFVGEQDTLGSDIAFRPGSSDTILVNRANLVSIITTPCLTATYLDHANGEAIISKEILALEPGDVMTVNIRATYYNEDNVETSTTSSVPYGYLAETITGFDLLNIFPAFRNGYPNYFRLTFIFNYNETEIQKEVEIQVLPSFIYSTVKENINWNRTLRFDLYTGSQATSQWGCMVLTNQYDCVLNYTVPGETEEDEAITKYIAELIPITKVRVGNLSGIYNDTFGANQPQGYGLYGENVYLTGNFYLNNGKSLVDISDDILLANGNIREVQDGLNNLKTSVRATIEALTLRQEAFENGLDATIKNYISTNKNAVLKIGLDYSIWALGSAGISMVNPNATYKFDPISGNYEVRPETVGDGDEYIALQGNKIEVNTYKTEYFEAYEQPGIVNPEPIEEYPAGFYMEVIFTTTRPEAWEYDANGSIYIPKVNNVPVEFAKGYIAALPEAFNTVPMTEESVNILHFVNLRSNDINTSGYIETVNEGTTTGAINFVPASALESNQEQSINETYSFNTYYQDTKNNASVYIKRSDNLLVKWNYFNSSNSIFYVPRVEQAGLFKNGKFNSKYIEAENLVAVDTETFEISTNGEQIALYEKNPRFNPKLPIDKEENYPVYFAGTKNAAEDANFVVISGSTGKITAKGASITGTILVGDKEDKHIKITDNKGQDAEESENVGPAIYIKNKDTILAQFGASIYENNPVATLLGGVSNQVASFSGTLSKTAYADIDIHSVNLTEQANYGYDEYGQPSQEPTYIATVEYFNRYDGTVASATFGSFVVPKSTTRGLNLKEGEIKLQASGTNITMTLPRYDTTVRLYAVCGDEQILFQTWYHASRSTKTFSINKRRFVIENNTDSDKTYEFKLVLTTVLFGEYTQELRERQLQDWIEDLELYYPTNQITWSCTLTKDLKYDLGVTDYMTRVLGNGLLVGYNQTNYFATYFTKPSQNEIKMVLEFQAEGYGLKFTGGNMYNIVAGHEVKSYIPILQGKIEVAVRSANDWIYAYYKFKGISVKSGTYTAGNEINANIPVIQYCPRYGDVVTEKHGWWIFGSKEYHRGTPYNMTGTPNNETDDTYFVLNYDSYHDICLVRGTQGQVLIYFGPSWEALLGENFITEDNLFINATGIGRDIPEDNGFASPGALYASVKAVRSWSTQANTSCRIAKVSTPDTDWSPHENLPARPAIKNMIQIALADDEDLNDGSFYISIAYCPN